VQSLSNIELLLVEDTKTQLLIMEGLLSDTDCLVITANSAEEAIQSCRRRKPLLILSDINMPGMNGYELCRTLRSDAEMNRIPVILLESFSERAAIKHCLECGASGFVFKELEEDSLKDGMSEADQLKLMHPLKEETRLKGMLEVAFLSAVYFGSKHD
jgi:two-component system, sensor histidine kinase and response regulator